MSVEVTVTALAEGAFYEHIPWDAVRLNLDYLFSLVFLGTCNLIRTLTS